MPVSHHHSAVVAAAIILTSLLLAMMGTAVGPANAASAGRPDPFPGVEEVTLGQLLVSLDAQATRMEMEPAYQQAFASLQQVQGLADQAYRDFVRVRMLFEATRDGGLWGVRWTITNREPQSDAIWAQWRTWTPPQPADEDPFTEYPSASGECDEISALFAFLVRRLGVSRVGLFWPLSNHTVAVWSAQAGSGQPVRVVVPTSQIFLAPSETLGTRHFDPATQRTIYDYTRADAPDTFTIPTALARAFIENIERSAQRTPQDLQAQRNARSSRHGGS